MTSSPRLARLQRGRQKYGLTLYLRREFRRGFDRFFRPVRPDQLRAALERVGVQRGMTLCVHSSLSRFGYIAGGAARVIDVILELVGPQGTVLMPSFPTAASVYDYLTRGEVFDVRSSPSKVGLITEEFRRRPDVRRSLHPTNPVTAWGARAEEYLRNHEHSETPYGHDTPYGRMATDPAASILMMETHVHSFLHHLQERVNLPGLFLDHPLPATLVDYDGQRRTITTKVMRPRTTYFVAVPSAAGDEPDWAILHDYALVFPPGRERLIRRHGYAFPGHPAIWERRSRLEQRGILRTTKLRGGTIGCLEVQGFLDLVEPEMRELVRRFARYYVPEEIAARKLMYL